MNSKTALAVCLVGILAAPLGAATIVLTRPGIAENDSLAWSVFGAAFTPVPEGSFALTTGGLTVTVSTSTATGMERRDAGTGWGTGGPFTAGTPLLWTDNENAASLFIDFNSPVLAAGLDIGRDTFGDYTAYVEAFNGATSLGVFSVAGDASDAIPFLGVFDAGGITRLAYYVDLNTADFAVDGLSIQWIPEPSTLFLVAGGLVAAFAWRRRRV